MLWPGKPKVYLLGDSPTSKSKKHRRGEHIVFLFIFSSLLRWNVSRLLPTARLTSSYCEGSYCSPKALVWRAEASGKIARTGRTDPAARKRATRSPPARCSFAHYPATLSRKIIPHNSHRPYESHGLLPLDQPRVFLCPCPPRRRALGGLFHSPTVGKAPTKMTSTWSGRSLL